MGLFLSVVPVGVDNERAEELGDYEPARSQKKTPSQDRNGMRGVPAELHPMSSFSISVSVE